MAGMYIVAIAWLYVAVLMSLTEPSVVGGIMTFLFYGLMPLTLFLWLFGGKHRRQRRAYREKMAAQRAAIAAQQKAAEEPSAVADQRLHTPDRGNAEGNQ